MNAIICVGQLFEFHSPCISKVEIDLANQVISFTQGPNLDFDFKRNIHRINETIRHAI